MATDGTYAEALREVREAAGKLQRVLAAELGFSRAMWSDVELGKRSAFHVSRSRDIAEMLEIDPVHLMALSAGERGIDFAMLEECDQEALEVLVSLVLLLPTMTDANVRSLRKLLDRLRE